MSSWTISAALNFHLRAYGIRDDTKGGYWSNREAKGLESKTVSVTWSMLVSSSKEENDLFMLATLTGMISPLTGT